MGRGGRTRAGGGQQRRWSADPRATPIDSEHDVRFTRTRRLIAADPSLLAEYNAIKIAHYGAATERYEAHKSVFFDRLVGRSPGTEQAD
jgi:hypothetical protein